MRIGIRLKRNYLLFLFTVVVLIAGCESKRVHPLRPETDTQKRLPHMGYTIQVGAFSQVENAVRLTELLKERGLEATYFVAPTGLYKVRFGDFASKSAARMRAEELKSAGTIDEYYIVSPDEYAIHRRQKYGDMYVRDELVKTAQSFIGVPYLWGGSSPDTGFDCSGLAMTVYQLNGLNLPRSSTEQYEAGNPVERKHLLKGDLVFFSTSNGNKISHVGIYMGDGSFVHAPGRGKKIRVDSLSEKYFSRRYRGGRSYL